MRSRDLLTWAHAGGRRHDSNFDLFEVHGLWVGAGSEELGRVDDTVGEGGHAELPYGDRAFEGVDLSGWKAADVVPPQRVFGPLFVAHQFSAADEREVGVVRRQLDHALELGACQVGGLGGLLALQVVGDRPREHRQDADADDE